MSWSNKDTLAEKWRATYVIYSCSCPIGNRT